MTEYINSSPYGDFECICGNEPSQDGFYPCDKQGNEVEPTKEDWTTNWYICAKCGRVINQDTLKVEKQVNRDKVKWLA